MLWAWLQVNAWLLASGFTDNNDNTVCVQVTEQADTVHLDAPAASVTSQLAQSQSWTGVKATHTCAFTSGDKQTNTYNYYEINLILQLINNRVCLSDKTHQLWWRRSEDESTL